MKKSSKSGFYSQPKMMLENKAQTIGKNTQNLKIKNELETKSTKHVENVPNLIPLDLQETRFRMEKLSIITKTRGVDKYKKLQKKGAEMKPMT